MKKTLIATAIAGAMSFSVVAQAAEVDFYGSLRVKAESATDQSLEIKDNSSRVGVKANTELDGGLTGIAHFETQVNTVTGAIGSGSAETEVDADATGGAGHDHDASTTVDLGGRLAYIGVKGDFGQVTAGRQWTPQYLWTSAKVDLLDHGSNPTHDYDIAGRKGNTLAYISPEISGLQLAAVVLAAGGASNDASEGDDFDAYNFAANYTMGDLSVGASTIMVNNDVKENYTAFAAGYTAGPAYVGVETTTDGLNDETTFEVAGSYQVMESAKALANFVSFEEGTQIAVEGQYALGEASRVSLSAVMADTKAEDAGEATDSIAASWRVDF